MVSPSSRKRRRDGDGEMQVPFSSTFEASQDLLSAINNNERYIIPANRGSASLFNIPRKTNNPLPVSKRFRLVEEDQPSNYYAHHHNQTSPYDPSQPQQSYFSHAHPQQTLTADASSHEPRPAITTTTTTITTTTTTTRTNSSALLSPCHICHRKPTKKSDLDSFADCTGCGERTCFVCLRACQGWLPVPPDGDDPNETVAAAEEAEEDLSASFIMRDVDDEESAARDGGDADGKAAAGARRSEQRQTKGEGGDGGWSGRGHRGVVCSRCCVERGSEGDVVCLGCLAGMRGA
ncbi:hypothetical protein SAMD00023353_0302040 [Rosellinia necatrix]|uniref:Uncharacterized protein n=1 Tax=Rosellinia necatrix TaxID=77044 RepID=A0A1W2TDJ7_ROSNE|nr:hypothetical protein SAMD00023353_0302040 [Rosellinia necatrix]